MARSGVNLSALTTIGRPLDWGVPTNRAIVLLFALAFAAGTLALGLLGQPVDRAAVRALGMAGAIFFGWALSRETDPDRPFAAFFGALGAAAGTFFLGGPSFLLLFWFLLSLRLINRTTGLRPGLLDLVAWVGLTAWLGVTLNWIVPILALPVLPFVDLTAQPRRAAIAVPVSLVVAAITLGITQNGALSLLGERSLIRLAVLGVVALSTIPLLYAYRNVRSVADRTGELLEPIRIQWTLAWAVGAGMLLAVLTPVSLREIAPLWSALAGGVLGVIVHGSIVRLRSGRASE